jgi:IclR family transcriptional regulator, KDG regulon repressor
MNVKKEKSFYNRSLERALQILCIFNTDRQALTLGQVADIAKLPKATVMRLCMTLLDYDFLRYDEQTKQYSLGLKLFELGSVVYSTFSLQRIVSPYLTRLQLKLAKTVFLGVLQGDELVYIDKRDDLRNPIRFASHIGIRRPPYFGMLGQLLMAYLPESEVNRLLKKTPLIALTKKSITDEAEFKSRLREIRKNQFALDEEGAIDGIAGISAPVRDFTGNVVGAIGVGYIFSSEDEKSKELIIEEVRVAAQEISRELGYFDEKKRVKRWGERSNQ